MNASHRLLWKLWPVAVIAVIAALWTANSRRPLSESAERVASDAVPGLAARMGELDRVVISTHAGVLATLERKDDGWWLAERNYLADSGKLRSLLLGLAEARRVEQKTSNPELYERLGVNDVEQDDARGSKLELHGGGEPVAFIVGDNTQRGSGTYLRLVGEAASWQIDRNVSVDKSAANWLQRELTDILPGRVEQVTIEHGKERIEIRADASKNGDFVVANLPRGREQASEFVADASAGLLQGLRLEDVAAAADQAPPEAVRKALFLLRDGLQLSLRSWQADGKTWAQFEAALDEARAGAAIEREQAKLRSEWEASQAAAKADPAASDAADATAAAAAGGSDAVQAAAAGDRTAETAAEAPLAVRDPQADRDQRLERLRAELATLQQRFAERSFQLPSYKASNLNRDLEAYLKPKA